MNFNWLNMQGVKSDTGFSLQQTGRFTAEYVDGQIRFEVPRADGITAAEAVKDCAVYRGLPLTYRQKILKHIRQAEKFMENMSPDNSVNVGNINLGSLRQFRFTLFVLI